MTQKYQQRFNELLEQLNELEATAEWVYDDYSRERRQAIDSNSLLAWKVKAKNLLSRACGEQSQHFKQFLESENSYVSYFEILQSLKAVFLAAKEDFEGGYLLSTRTLVQAEVLDSELEQARELLNKGFYVAAAVIAGVVLETSLRELCAQNSLPYGKLDKMNADLAKAGIYHKLRQKRITALADIRNSAAHGKPEEFTVQDVENMMKEVEVFLAENLQA